jgi:hypothetical protein
MRSTLYPRSVRHVAVACALVSQLKSLALVALAVLIAWSTLIVYSHSLPATASLESEKTWET